MSFKHKSSYIELDDQDLRLANGVKFERKSVEIFDHFAYGAGAFNSHVPQNWVTTETGAATPFAPGATGASEMIGVTGGTTDNAQEFAGKAVIWKPSAMGTLVFEMRAKFVGATTATDGDFYFGFSDAVTETNGLPYVVSAASALTTHAPSNAVLFAYSSIPTSGALYSASGNYIGVITTKADTDTVAATTTVKDSNYHTYRIEIDASGNAFFYIDGVHVKSVALAVTADTALVTYMSVIAKNSHAHTATVDYVYVGGGLGT
jgi:hypothetical protein